MMKLSVVLAASLTAALFSTQALSAGSAGISLESADGSYQVAGLAWRCGRNNPAEWGTFGNGCLKQKRAAKKNGSASTGSGNFAIELPPPPPRLQLRN